MDYVGPRYARGQTWYYLVIIDHATRYVVTSATPAPTEEHARITLHDGWVQYFGAPHVVLTDNAKQFTARKFEQYVVTKLYATLTRTSPYNPEGNAINESVHQSLERGLKVRLTTPTAATFPELVRAVTAAYNSGWQSALRSSPFQALFGRDMALPGMQQLQRYINEGERKYVQKMRTYIQEITPHLPRFPDEGEQLTAGDVKVGDFCVFERSDTDQRNFNPDGLSAHAYGLQWSLPARVMEVHTHRVQVKEYATGQERLVPLNKIRLLPKELPQTLKKINWEHIQLTLPPVWKTSLDPELLPEVYQSVARREQLGEEVYTTEPPGL